MGGAVERRPHLLELGSTIVQDRGIVTYFQLLVGTVEEKVKERAVLTKEMDTLLAEQFPNVFYRVDVVTDVYEGSLSVAQSYGLGNFEANTVMLGWMSKTERSQDYVRLLRGLTVLDRSLLLVHYHPERKLGRYRKIQIWWGGLKGNGGMMLLIAFLMTNQSKWRGATVSVVTVVGNEKERRRTSRNIEAVLQNARLEASAQVILRGDKSIQTIMEEQSRDVDLAIIGIRLPGNEAQASQFTERMNGLLEHLPTTIMVRSAQGFQGEPVLFDTTETTEVPPVASSKEA
jgi:hypothetical protein